ncbi:FkbM family methyltransferase [Verrucomicrobium sp. 3C]|uniref:FkbM family methyltransferase n=1 Tax=Verrucomicrobium sp. 3C TaxID=1134055 RepID=UPI001E2C06E1|nr:FkbM family methyltransferase [Verrucomicrobium sp. 3C]
MNGRPGLRDRSQQEAGCTDQPRHLPWGEAVKRWLSDRELSIFSHLSGFRRFCRGGELPGLSKAAILMDYLRMKCGQGMEKSGDGIVRIAGRPWACLKRGAATGLYRQIFLFRDYEFRSANPAPRILDCGANIGLATLFFKLSYPQSQIDAFEADPDLATILERNVQGNELSNVNVHCCALAKGEGEIDFYPSGTTTTNGSVQADLWRGGEPVRVQARRLSEWIGDEVDFLKMDIEGAESEVIAELSESGALVRVREAVVEYHHNHHGFEGGQSGLARFLDFWERAGFSYQLSADGAGIGWPRVHFFLIRFRRVADLKG